MITVEVSSNTADKAVESFTEHTVRRVRTPNVPLWLTVNADRPCFIVVDVDGEEYNALPLLPQPQAFRLSELLRKPERPSRFASLIKPFVSKPQAQPALPSAFTVRIHEDSPDGPRVGTFEFQLLNDAEYDVAYASYTRSNTGRCEEVACFTTDARSIETAHDCWNCKQALAAGECCPKCGCEQHDE